MQEPTTGPLRPRTPRGSMAMRRSLTLPAVTGTDTERTGVSGQGNALAARWAVLDGDMSYTRHGRKIGRPDKGDRDVLYTRVPREVGDAIRARAEETGMTISDVVAAFAADALGMSHLAPRPAPAEQEELPLKTA